MAFGGVNVPGKLNPEDIGAAPANHSHSGYLAVSGGTMTGSLYLPQDPTQSQQAATKHYVDIHAILPPIAKITLRPYSTSSPGRTYNIKLEPYEARELCYRMPFTTTTIDQNGWVAVEIEPPAGFAFVYGTYTGYKLPILRYSTPSGGTDTVQGVLDSDGVITYAIPAISMVVHDFTFLSGLANISDVLVFLEVA